MVSDEKIFFGQKVTSVKSLVLSLDFFSKIQENLLKTNLKRKIEGNYFKIKIRSQQDIENISKAFENK